MLKSLLGETMKEMEKSDSFRAANSTFPSSSWLISHTYFDICILLLVIFTYGCLGFFSQTKKVND